MKRVYPLSVSKKLSLLFFLFIVITVLSLSISIIKTLVKAQNAGQSLEVSPPSQDIEADPGDTVTIKAKIRNPSNQTLPISVHLEDFTAVGEEGQVALTQGGKYSVVSWAKVNPTRFNLKPGEQKEVTATIKIPQNAAGGRYGSFIFAVTPENNENMTAASVSQQVASLFLLRISGPVKEKLELKGITAPRFSEFGPIPFRLKFENKGNVHVKTYGLINVTDIFGRKVSDIVVTGTNVFPEATRIIQTQLNKTFLIGPYTATAIMYYGTSNEVLNATTTFYVFPVRVAGLIIALIIVLYLLRKRIIRAFKVLFRG